MSARRLVLPLLMAALLVALGAVPAVAGSRWPAGLRPAAGPRPVGGPIVVIGVPGLRWDDVSAGGTPNLWRLAGTAALANMSTRSATSQTCPADGWLTVSAGQRATLDGRTPKVCPPSPEPVPGGAGSAATVPGFAAIQRVNRRGKYGASVGLLGSAIERAGGRTLAVGSGAALAAADDGGRVGAYYPRASSVSAAAWAGATLAVVDADELQGAYLSGSAVSKAQRRAAVRAADTDLGRVLAELPAGSTILLGGVSDNDRVPVLHVALSTVLGGGAQAATPSGSAGGAGHGVRALTSASTRREWLVTLTDLTTTVLADAHVAAVPKEAVGRPWKATGETTGLGSAAASLRDANRAALIYGHLDGMFWGVFVIVQVLIYGGAGLVLRRQWSGVRRRRVLAMTRFAALAGTAVPVASYLANVIPWSTYRHPVGLLVTCIVLADLLVVGVALAGPWRRDVMAPTTIVAGLTAVVFAADVMTGSRLQMDSMAGYSPIVAGRFYGFGNIAFAAYATAVLITAAGVAHLLRARPGRAVSAVVAIGIVAEIITAWPGWGAKFGGTITFIPGIAVAALMIAGRRVSVLKLAAFTGAGVVVIAVFAFADYLRPATARTHLGQFAGQVLDGEAVTVVHRKFGAMLGTAGNWPMTLAAVAAVLFCWLVLVRPPPWRPAALALAYQRAPALRAGLAGAFATSGLGLFVEDSGVALPGVGLTLAVPLALAGAVRAVELCGNEDHVVGAIGDLTRH